VAFTKNNGNLISKLKNERSKLTVTFLTARNVTFLIRSLDHRSPHKRNPTTFFQCSSSFLNCASYSAFPTHPNLEHTTNITCNKCSETNFTVQEYSVSAVNFVLKESVFSRALHIFCNFIGKRIKNINWTLFSSSSSIVSDSSFALLSNLSYMHKFQVSEIRKLSHKLF